MFKYVILFSISVFFVTNLYSMEKKPYHHLPDGTLEILKDPQNVTRMLSGHTKFLMPKERK